MNMPRAIGVDRPKMTPQTWLVKVRCYDGRAETVKAVTSQADAEAWAANLNTERDDAPYFAESSK
jgi:hypothetical protein